MAEYDEKNKDETRNYISWQAPEYEYYQKEAGWYWISLIVGIVLIAISLWQENFLFAVFIVIAWILLINISGRFPTIWEFNLDEKGLTIRLPNVDASHKPKFYPMHNIEGFDIHPATDEYKELIFKFKSKFSTYLKINFYSQDEEKIKSFLLNFMPHMEYDRNFIDSLSHLIRF